MEEKGRRTKLENQTGTRKLIPVWTPQIGPQTDAITATWCPILLYGGAKYGGKSDFLLGDYLQDVPTYGEHWQGILFRRSYKQFTELITRSKQLYPRCGAEWKKGDSEWHFKEGGVLRFRYLESLDDLENYWGHSYPWIGVDELGEWEDKTAFFRLFTLLRYGAAPIPTKRLRASANPGGAGHVFVKEYFIDEAPLGYQPLFDEELKMYRLFIPASIDDNIIGLLNDPGYEARMNRAGSPELVKAWRYGIWNIVAGAFFPEFGDKHIIRPFKIPSHWTRFMSMDWGSCGEADPFSIGWWAVSDGVDTPYPRGSIIRYREWYGAGLPKVTVIADVAPGIKEREQGESIAYRVVGGDLSKTTGTGPSAREQFQNEGLSFIKADQRRTEGWIQFRECLVGRDSRPKIYCFATCTDSIKMIPALQHDKRDANDAADGNDHIAEDWRYGVMSRPWATEAVIQKDPLASFEKKPTIDDMWQLREEMLRAQREYE